VILRLSLRRRACRAGQRCRLRLLAAETVTSSVRPSHFAGEIPTNIGNRKQSVAADQLFDGRDARSSVLRRIHRRNPLSIIRVNRLGLLNAQSVHNKCANIQQWIRSRKLNIVGLVETWHDDRSSPDLIACAPPGYKYVEKARARKDELSMSTTTAASVYCTMRYYTSDA